jgi:hypothetical protein
VSPDGFSVGQVASGLISRVAPGLRYSRSQDEERMITPSTAASVPRCRFILSTVAPVENLPFRLKPLIERIALSKASLSVDFIGPLRDKRI